MGSIKAFFQSLYTTSVDKAIADFHKAIAKLERVAQHQLEQKAAHLAAAAAAQDAAAAAHAEATRVTAISSKLSEIVGTPK